MNSEKIGLQTWKERFDQMEQEIQANLNDFPIMPVIITPQAMLIYVQFTKELIEEKLAAERKEYDMRDYESYGFSADQERIRNGEEITPDQAPRLNRSEWW